MDARPSLNTKICSISTLIILTRWRSIDEAVIRKYGFRIEHQDGQDTAESLLFLVCRLKLVIIEWLLDLSLCRLSTDALVIREFITPELSPRKREASLHTRSAAALKELEHQRALRVDSLPRPGSQAMIGYVHPVTMQIYHNSVSTASRFARLYHRIVDSYLLIDRKAETSIKYLALQL